MRAAFRGRRAPWAALAALLALQALISAGRLNLPFQDGRLHWNYDSAVSLLRAVHCSDRTLSSSWQVLGLKEYRYDEAGAVSGFSHYNHHPVLPSALFNAWARLLGFGVWVPRLFALLISLAVTAMLFSLLRKAGADVPAAAGLTLLHLLLPLYFNYQDAWKHESVVTLLLLANFYLLLEPESRRTRRLFPAAFFLLFQSGWAAYPVGAGLAAYLFWTGRRPLALKALWAGAAGILVNFLLLRGLGFTSGLMREQALFRMAGGMDLVSWPVWAKRQLGFLAMNFGASNMAVLAALTVWAMPSGRRSVGPLAFFGLLTLASGLAWVCVFRNLSQSHHYAQWYIGPAYVLLFGEAAIQARRRSAGFWKTAPAWAALPLALASLYGALRLKAMIHEGPFGTPEDLSAISALNSRLLVASDGASGPKDWWISSNITLYSDPFYKAWLRGSPGRPARGGVRLLEDARRFDPETDFFAALKRPDAIQHVEMLADKKFGVRRFALVRETPTFVFFRAATFAGKG